MRVVVMAGALLALGGLDTPALAQCAGQYDPQIGTNFAPCPPLSLYQRLEVKDGTGTLRGGRDALALIVDDFVANLVADGRTKARFGALKPPEVAKLKSLLADQLCEVSGGPCAYYGRDMKATHAGMKITEAEWTATVEALGKALDKYKIRAKEKEDLLAALGPMKKDIVGQ
ncbi:MAG: group I truncated hemoglobin [Candidatus Rokuibacteriota bacterium]